MRRALTPALALFLAAGISIAGPELIEPDPVDPMTGDVVATLTAVRAGSMPSTPTPGDGRVQPISNNQTTERTISCTTN